MWEKIGSLKKLMCGQPSGNYSGRSWMRVNVPRVALGLYQIWKTKTGKTPCAWCKMALTSHWYCDWLRIPRASSGIFSQSQHHPIGFCIKHKAINRKNNCSAGNITEYSVRRMDNSILFAAVRLVQSWKDRLYLLQEMFFLFIALKRMSAFWKKVGLGFRFGR